MNGGLSRAEFEALAAPLGVGWRTLEYYANEGLIAKPIRIGHGQRKSAEFRWPLAVAAQLEALAEARKHTHSWVGLRHWMWWDGFPIEWERWRADRMPVLDRFSHAGEGLRNMGFSQRGNSESALAGYWAGRRPRPFRLNELWTATVPVRASAATWLLDLMAGGRLPEDLTARFDDDGQPTVGEVIDHIFRLQLLRNQGVTVRGAPGEFASKWLSAMPSTTECARGFELLTESEAVQLRDRVKRLEALEDGRFYLPHRPLREVPELAALTLPLMFWLIALEALRHRSVA